MDIKTKLKERLLEIPVSYNAFREKYRLASDLNVKPEEIEQLLNELCKRDILKEKIEYICPTCRESTVLYSQLIEMMTIEDNCFECEECGDLVNSIKDKTGYVFYSVNNRQDLINW
ncbi:hypothetical protein [Alkaliphilus sp. B6464]|uniref:hypothetical protein n=1 Tax=Alkaliphilus sp. B6464 TaxID=2731219 RepID=UPI001BAD27D4|nr:hypothetical protein [Alkaliphilus sp. B6464]QUH22209.1 hypothetical protein HYG84_20085 [Alkaliphilus sp. B6464]